MLDQAIHSLAHAHGAPALHARLRSAPEDFYVTELPVAEPAGEGEHAWLWVRKRNLTTPQAAAQLARLAQVASRQVSFAGLKDRRAVTEQWFSVHLPGRVDPDWSQLTGDALQVLRHVRHTRKLRRGALRGNSFCIVLREPAGLSSNWQDRLEQLARRGVPNYFGEQRFGHDAANLQTAQRLFANPRLRLSHERRGLALSAARSLLFNRVLDERVRQGNWDAALTGDAMQLAGSHSFFIVQQVDTDLRGRLQSHDIHPTGPLYGRGDNPARADCRALEQSVLAGFADWCAGLAAAGLQFDRRALRVVPEALEGKLTDDGQWRLTFSLPAGCYATAVLRELVDTGGW